MNDINGFIPVSELELLRLRRSTNNRYEHNTVSVLIILIKINIKQTFQ